MRRSLIALTGLVLAGCTFAAMAEPASNTQPKPSLGTWGIDLTGMDKNVKPGDNFFGYVNGGWFKTAVIPADRSSTGSFQTLQILSEQRMRTIVDGLEARPYAQLSPEERKLRDLYDAFVDQKQIDSRGLTPVKADLSRIAAAKSLKEIARIMGSVPMNVLSIFNVGIGVDDKNPNAYAIGLSQSGLGLPDRDYYLRDDKALAATRDAYKKYLTDMLTLAGMTDADGRAAKILALETEIAKVSWTRADDRDADKIYNPMSYSDLKAHRKARAW
jgi:putative endopeptidase